MDLVLIESLQIILLFRETYVVQRCYKRFPGETACRFHRRRSNNTLFASHVKNQNLHMTVLSRFCRFKKEARRRHNLKKKGRKKNRQISPSVVFDSFGRGRKMSPIAARAKLHVAMVVFQTGYAGNHVIMRFALNLGVSKLVFPLYRTIVALSVLAPSAYFLEKYTLQSNQYFQLFIPVLCNIDSQYLLFVYGKLNQKRKAGDEHQFSDSVLPSWTCRVRSSFKTLDCRLDLIYFCLFVIYILA